MLNTEMLARMRSFLDEATAVFYNDTTELYPALSLAQDEVAKQVADGWKERQDRTTTPIKPPLTLVGLRTIETGTISSGNQVVAIAGDPLQVLLVIWQFDGAIVNGSPYALELAEGNRVGRITQNSLLADGVYYYYTQSQLTVYPRSTNASAGYTIIFWDKPADISSSVQPELDTVAHDAIIERALWILLKDRETEQATTHLQLYGTLLEGLMK